MASTLTKLEVANNALNSIGERSLTSIGGILGNMVESSIREAIYAVAVSNEWSELHSIVNASSWSAEKATMPARTYRVREVYYYTSPDGAAEATYDYNKYIVPFITVQEFQQQVLWQFDDNEAATVNWTKLTDQIIQVNPYPTNATARSKIYFSVYRYPALPSSDTDTFSCGDLMTNLIQYKCAELLAIKHIGDLDQASALKQLYMDSWKQLMISDGGVPSLTMYKGGRR